MVNYSLANDNSVIVSSTCPICGKTNPDITIDKSQYSMYLSGSLLQDAFPNLSANEREMIKTGICNDCWSNMFKDEED